jgi:hypothetical protein
MTTMVTMMAMMMTTTTMMTMFLNEAPQQRLLHLALHLEAASREGGKKKEEKLSGVSLREENPNKTKRS